MTELWDRTRATHAFKQFVSVLHARLLTPLDTTARSWTTGVATTVFLVVAFVSFRTVGAIDLDARLLLLGACLTPVRQWANAAEFRILGALVRQEVGWWEALEITTLATAANLLPLPGGSLVKVREMGARCGSVRSTLFATVLIGMYWLAVACAIAGIGLLMMAQTLAAALFGIGCAGVFGLAALIAPGGMSGQLPVLLRLILVETVLCLTAALRISIVMAGIGLDASIPLTMVLAASGPAAALLGFFPGGLGLQELIAGLLAPVALAGPEVGVAAIASDRVIGYAALAFGAGVIWMAPKVLHSKRSR